MDIGKAIDGDSVGASPCEKIRVVSGDFGMTFRTEDFVTLNELIKPPYMNNISDSDIVVVIIDSFLSGKVYMYNNYNDKNWYIYGETVGFA